jgi:hypothetical protein
MVIRRDRVINTMVIAMATLIIIKTKATEVTTKISPRTAHQRPPSRPRQKQAPGARKEENSFQDHCELAAAPSAVMPSPKDQHEAAQTLQVQFGT